MSPSGPAAIVDGLLRLGDTDGALAYDAAKLDDCLNALRSWDQQTYGAPEPIAVIGNSMGGAITRGWLQLAKARNSQSLSTVTTTILLEGATEGSWFAGLGQGANNAMLAAGLDNPAWLLVRYVADQVAGSQGIDPTRPGVQDLAPGSDYFNSIVAAGPPPHLHYFTLSVDITVHFRLDALFVHLDGSADVVGDGIIQTGDPAYSGQPTGGGSQFLPFGWAPDQHQYLINRSENEGIIDIPGAAVDVFGDAYSHFNFGTSIGSNSVQSCKSCIGNGSNRHRADPHFAKAERPVHWMTTLKRGAWLGLLVALTSLLEQLKTPRLVLGCMRERVVRCLTHSFDAKPCYCSSPAARPPRPERS